MVSDRRLYEGPRQKKEEQWGGEDRRTRFTGNKRFGSDQVMQAVPRRSELTGQYTHIETSYPPQADPSAFSRLQAAGEAPSCVR